MKFLKSLKVFKGNKYEFYFSFPIVLFGLFHYAARPADFYDIVIAVGALLLALLCAFNAVLDHRRMTIIEFGPALIWFAILLYVSPFVLHEAFTTRVFADR